MVRRSNWPPRSCRLRQLAAQAHNNKPENDSTKAADIRFDDGAHKHCRRTWSLVGGCLHKTLMRQRQAESGG
jgi:hypothetical protein